jgi:hypothetical protein
MLKNINLSIPKMENALFVLSLVFCVCYIIQYVYYPVVIFSGAQTDMLTTEDLRIRLEGQGLVSLGYFLGLNKYLKNIKNIFYLLLSLVCFGVIFLMGFRTMLVILIIFTFAMIIRIKGVSRELLLYGVVSAGVFIVALQLPIFNEKVYSMLERQKTQVFSNENYIRVIQFQYFTQEHFKNIWEYIFGSGMPGAGSAYNQYMDGLLNRGITWVDLGLLSLSWVIGIPAVIAMILYSLKASFLKVSSEYYYQGIWFIYLVAISFTTMEFFRPGNFVVQALVLYLVEKAHNNYLQNQLQKT